jgi:hypothetical protein
LDLVARRVERISLLEVEDSVAGGGGAGVDVNPVDIELVDEFSHEAVNNGDAASAIVVDDDGIGQGVAAGEGERPRVRGEARSNGEQATVIQRLNARPEARQGLTIHGETP